jgi:hypothetical protein
LSLGSYAAEKRLAILSDLQQGMPPREGRYDAAQLTSARTKGKAQMGATRFEPRAILLEFIFPDPAGGTAVLTVTLDPPERIVFMPIPEWVVESIWQGEISGSAHFESEAMRMLEAFGARLSEAENAAEFGRVEPIARRD